MARMARHRTIAVVTGARAEFGLLEPVMRAIEAHGRLKLRLMAAGLHLTQNTWREIGKAGFEIHARLPMQKKDKHGRRADIKAAGRGLAGCADLYAKLQPDVVLVLGDRIEAFAAAAAASIGGLRVAHIHGGDRAEGVADEAMRHAVTKLAHLHFPATVQSQKRIFRMGEHEATVFHVGSPAADGLDEIVADQNGPELIVLQHPVGESDAQEQRWMQQTLAAVSGYETMVLAPNADAGCRGVLAALRKMRIEPMTNLPRRRFLSLLKGARAMVGNSSAGLIEAAILKTPCVNIGPRQAGREKGAHVIDCAHGQFAVRQAIERAVDLNLRRMKHPYGGGDAGPRIADILATFDADLVPVRKRNSY